MTQLMSVFFANMLPMMLFFPWGVRRGVKGKGKAERIGDSCCEDQ